MKGYLQAIMAELGLARQVFEEREEWRQMVETDLVIQRLHVVIELTDESEAAPSVPGAGADQDLGDGGDDPR